MARMNREKVVASALWAAWGDALGFMTELATPEIVEIRTGATSVSGTTPWKRKIGGRTGVTIEFPAGTYSDDTQLRLATSRAIRSDGRFDVEAFSKIELPVFLDYALGAGRGTKAAASGLSRPKSSWCTNFFNSEGQSYVAGGGNGAAMRIQPHVWASPAPSEWEGWLPDVVRNVVTTHGHVRAIAGAVVHASLLADALERQEIRPPGQWKFVIEVLEGVERFISSDEELSSLWLPSWESASGMQFHSAMREAILKFRHDLSIIGRSPKDLKHWPELVARLGGLERATRGAGDTTALLSGALAWASKEAPDTGLIHATNLLGSDTDTIATMAGAILGAVGTSLPPGPIQDEEFIGRESNRLARIGLNESNRHFRYPDLLTWSVPRASLDVVGLVDDRLAIMGLGFLDADAHGVTNGGRNPMFWRWGKLTFNQTILIRHRENPRQMDTRFLPGQPLQHRPSQEVIRGQSTLFESSLPTPTSNQQAAEHSPDVAPRDQVNFESVLASGKVSEIIEALQAMGMPPAQIGAAVIALAKRDAGSAALQEFVELTVNALSNDSANRDGHQRLGKD
jgi:ADP-ribosylglycohydrolase